MGEKEQVEVREWNMKIEGAGDREEGQRLEGDDKMLDKGVETGRREGERRANKQSR